MPVDDLDTARVLAAVLHDTAVRAAVTAERALLAALEAGCSAPVGALADVVEDLDDDGPVVPAAATLRRSCYPWVPAPDSSLPVR